MNRLAVIVVWMVLGAIVFTVPAVADKAKAAKTPAKAEKGKTAKGGNAKKDDAGVSDGGDDGGWRDTDEGAGGPDANEGAGGPDASDRPAGGGKGDKKIDPEQDGVGPTGILGTMQKGKLTVEGVQRGSPADGKLKKGDVIVGIGGAQIPAKQRDWHQAFSNAIETAETAEAGGKLRVLLESKKEVILQLQVLGSYSPTAPYKCQKTDKIVTLAAEALLREASGKTKKKKDGGWLESPTKVELLGLLATGEKKYVDAVLADIKTWASVPDGGKPLQEDGNGRDSCWSMGYTTILLSECYLLTKDKSILPTLETYALSLARAQDAAGLYGHKNSVPANYRAPGYGVMNQVSLSCFIGMLLAKKCGVDVPGLDEAIAKTRAYVELHVGRGTFPYGFHGPREWEFNNNGMSGSAAIAMSIAGNQKGAAFFGGMSAASAEKMGHGHGSALFSAYWTPAGAHVAGPEVTQRFFRQSIPYHTIRRQWNGSFSDIGREGREEGVALLAYCLPRQALIITGREADDSIWLDAKDAEAVTTMGGIEYKDATPDELLAHFGHDYVPVRSQAVRELRMRADPKKDKAPAPADVKAMAAVFPKLEAMLAADAPFERHSAMSCYLLACPQDQMNARIGKVVSVLRNKQEPDDLRVAAAMQLALAGSDAHAFFDDILAFLLEERPGDHFAYVDFQLAEAIGFILRDTDPYSAGLVKNKDLYYRAAARLMEHKLQNTRGTGVRMVEHMPREDFYRVADKLDHILKDDDRGYYSYSNPLQCMLPAAQIFADFRIAEGMGYIVDMLFAKTGKWSFKLGAVMKTLPLYGGNAKPYIPRMMEHPIIMAMCERQSDRFFPGWKKMIDDIQNDTNPPKLTTLEEVRREYSKSE